MSMCSFDYHFTGQWCMNMMDHLMSCFWEDLRESAEKEKMAKNKENKK